MALRITGSVIGEPITSSSSSATGMWTSQEVAALQQDGIWQIAPTFSLTASASNVNEGSVVTATLTTTGIANGAIIPYVITGANIFANDFTLGNITGNFVIQNGSNTISFTSNADVTAEGLETFTITAGTASANILINDTSTDSDPQFPYTTLLLKGDGTNNSQNNTFLDASTNNFTLTRNGNSTQGTFTPYGSNWSNYFDGSDDYLIVNYASGSTIAGNFTWETWVYDTGAAAYGTLIGWRNGSSGWTGFLVQRNNNNNNLTVSFNNGAATINQATGTYLPNQWNHVALVRSGTTVTLYVNGTSAGTATVSGSFNPGSSYWIGSDPYNDVSVVRLQGYISNQRFVNGTAIYTENFTPPTAPLTPIANTGLLTCQSNRVMDNSINNFAITNNGGFTVQRFSPFSPTQAYSTSTIGGSGYFDGTGDYLSTPGNTAFVLGTGDFTFEVWLYANSISTGTFDRICATSDYNGSGFDWTLNTSSSGLFLASTSYSIGSITPKVWHHLVYTRSGSTIRGFLNGNLSSYATSGSQNISSTSTLNIGAGYSGTALNGYLSDLRIIKGSIPAAYQTSSSTTGTQIFTPPGAPLTTIVNTSLLCNFTNAGIIDNAMMTTLETVGDAKISTTQSKFGGTSMFFDGTGDYLFSPTLNVNNLSKFLTSNFTVECWIYPTTTSGDRTVICAVNNWSAGANYEIELRSGVLFVQIGNSITLTSGTTSISANTWTHIALVRSSTTSTTFYVNGVSVATTATNWTADEDCPLTIGCFNSNGGSLSNYWQGYIDDLRITKGYARYTTTFTPPTRTLPGY